MGRLLLLCLSVLKQGLSLHLELDSSDTPAGQQAPEPLLSRPCSARVQQCAVVYAGVQQCAIVYAGVQQCPVV